jgi:bifunctional non-homologous end joining protein LigD
MASRPHNDSLRTYRAKRNFTRTAEPSGNAKAKPAPGAEAKSNRRFVVQKHAATRLHYDFRLELDGVLLSWAVTRGPSANPADKRLAVRTEDHPLEYAVFEGTIPKGEYGGGTVMLWDEGTWEPHPGKDPRKTLAEGHIHFTLQGQRMKGEWLLIRLKPRGKEKSENWLLRKLDDEHAGGSDDLVGMNLTSIATSRTMEEIAVGKRGRARKAGKQRDGQSGSRRDKAVRKLPPFRAVQLATLVDQVPAGNRWLHEIKYDGYRTLLAIGGGEVRAYTRSGLDWSERYPAVLGAAAGLDVASALIDGEATVVLPDGRTSFQALQAALKQSPGDIVFYAFDLLELDGKDLTGRPLAERKQKLAALLSAEDGALFYSDHFVGRGEELLEQACKTGLEGIVSKRGDSRYVGARTASWVKTKCTRRQEFVIVGWVPSDKGREFRSLLLATHENGDLRYAGKVGTGFSAGLREDLLSRMALLERKRPTVAAPRGDVRGARWIAPELVAEIAFAEFTEQGILRHSSFLGLRGDKDAKGVELEAPRPVNQVTVAVPPSSSVKISNRQRIIFPEGKLTKGDLADYYEAVAGLMLPWIGNRPISLVRCPQGRAKKCFFQKHDAGTFGKAVHQIPIAEKDGHQEDYLYVDSAEGLLTCVQMGTIEFHGWGSRIEDVERADRLVFDLDPDEGLGFEEVVAAAFRVSELLAEIGLVTFPMVTGGKGVHVIAPLRPVAEWPQVKDFAHRFALALAQAEPKRFTAALAKAKRKGLIFLDYLRNQRGATAVMPYSARSREGGPIAVPVSWEELRGLGKPNRWHITDAEEMLARAASQDLVHWGRADQAMPEV